YISDRFLPDKAIDLVDEAAAKLRTEIDSMPTELDEVSRRVMQLEIEREALKKEKDPASRDRLGRLGKEPAHPDAHAPTPRPDAPTGRPRRTPYNAGAASANTSSRPKSTSNRPSGATT